MKVRFYSRDINFKICFVNGKDYFLLQLVKDNSVWDEYLFAINRDNLTDEVVNKEAKNMLERWSNNDEKVLDPKQWEELFTHTS